MSGCKASWSDNIPPTGGQLKGSTVLNDGNNYNT